MATTTIPWGDGSGGNIYLTYPSASGDQTVEVTSDANTGAARSKVVSFTSGVGSVVRQLTVSQDAGGITPHYLVYGSPTINGTSYSPDMTARGFICTDEPFDPGTSGWVIQTRLKINTAVAWKDIISSVDANGASARSITCQTNTNSSNKGYGLYLSSNGTSWNVTSNQPTGTFPTGTWYTFQIVCTRSGSNYYYKMGYPDTGSWTGQTQRTAAPVFGRYISFGAGYANLGIDAEYDLSYTKIWINGNLWWEAIT